MKIINVKTRKLALSIASHYILHGRGVRIIYNKKFDGYEVRITARGQK